LGSELHDIGKMSIPDAILNKPGPLDDREREFMRRHTVIGERILQADAPLAHVVPVARSRHECWDGRGYPDGLVGDQIPLAARVVAVCDAYQAMIADRPYRRGCSTAEALAELLRCRGAQFDPAVVDTFLAVVSREDAQKAA
jgi:HD-GYP domain-containing protein (c-di-GMP phosphodiesterase class II)